MCAKHVSNSFVLSPRVLIQRNPCQQSNRTIREMLNPIRLFHSLESQLSHELGEKTSLSIAPVNSEVAVHIYSELCHNQQ